jgi:hypothetical protein
MSFNFFAVLFSVVLVSAFIYYLTKSKLVYFGYRTLVGLRGIQKEYGSVDVCFYHWGSQDFIADGNDPYLGFYGTITMPREIKLNFLANFFDQIEFEDIANDRLLISFQKKGVFIGEKKFKELIEKFDRNLIKKLNDQNHGMDIIK